MVLKKNILFEAFRGLVSPSTTKYPKHPYIPPDGYKGAAEYDPEKCVGCGACSQECPPGAITFLNTEGTRDFKLNYGICSFCGRCEEICPWDAIHLTKKYEMAVYEHKDAETGISVSLFRCIECGRPFFPAPQMKASLEKVQETLAEYRITREELENLMSLCPTCAFSTENIPRRRMFLRKLVR